MPQLNRTNLLTDIITNIFNNITKFITGNNAQQRMVNIVDSVPNILTDKNQLEGYVGTDANNEMQQSYVRENQLLISLQILESGGNLVGGKAYIINDAIGASAELYVRAIDASNLYAQALNLTTGEVGTYVLSTDTFTPISGSSLDLETDGVPNVDQTLLNLEAGTNITLTDDGFGTVTIDAAGGSGNASITPILVAALQALETAGTLSLTTLYLITDSAVGYKLLCKANGVSTLSTNAIIIDNTFAGTVHYILASDQVGNSTIYDEFGNTWNAGLLSGTTLGTGSKLNTFNTLSDNNTLGVDCRYNTFSENSTTNTLGDNCEYNTFSETSSSNTLGDDCEYNNFIKGASNYIFGNNLTSVTVKSPNGADYTNLTDYGFMYNLPYTSEIIRNPENTANYHKYYDPTNDRIVLTNLTTLAVTYIGGTGGGGIVNLSGVSLGTFTGATGHSFVGSILIPANTLDVGVFRISMAFTFVGTAGTKLPRIYVNTANNLSGALIIGSMPAGGAGTLMNIGSRDITVAVKDGTGNGTIVVLNTATSSESEGTYTNFSILAIDWGVAQYLIGSINLANIADLADLTSLKIIG